MGSILAERERERGGKMGKQTNRKQRKEMATKVSNKRDKELIRHWSKCIKETPKTIPDPDKIKLNNPDLRTSFCVLKSGVWF